jgi:pullulanase/glycogen debranching enzyme
LTEIRGTHLALTIVFLPLGVPMLGQGTELLHSKGGVANTYRCGDLNALPYDRQREYLFPHKHGQRLIQLRNGLPSFCLCWLPSDEYIQIFTAQKGNSSLLTLFNATYERGPEEVLLALDPHSEKVHFAIPFGNNFTQIADPCSFSDGNCAIYLCRDDILELPPLSCGIWRREKNQNNL